MREKLRAAERGLVWLESALLAALLAFMTGLAFVQVARRQLFGTGALWADTLLRHLVLWVGFLGAAIAAADEKHFAWEAAAERGGPKLKAAAQAAAAIVSAFLVAASVSFFKDEYAAGQTLFRIGSVAVPSWLFALAVPVGFGLVLIHAALRSIHALTGKP